MPDNGIIHLDPDYESIINEYIIEAIEQIIFLERSILSATENIDYINIKRIAHNIKGSAGSFGITIVSSLFHDFENSIKELESESVLKFTDSQVDRFLSFLDFSKQILQRITARKYDISDIIINIEKKLYRRSVDKNYDIGANAKHILSSGENFENEDNTNLKNIAGSENANITPRTYTVKNADTAEKKKKILLIEKSNLVRKMIVSKLISLPYDIIFSDCIEDSIKLIINHQPYVIIANNIEQYFHGGGLCAFLKHSFLKDNFISIIIATANGDVEGIEHCNYVVKKDSSLYNNIFEIINKLG